VKVFFGLCVGYRIRKVHFIECVGEEFKDFFG
jgi:hypothetical protein